MSLSRTALAAFHSGFGEELGCSQQSWRDALAGQTVSLHAVGLQHSAIPLERLVLLDLTALLTPWTCVSQDCCELPSLNL